MSEVMIVMMLLRMFVMVLVSILEILLMLFCRCDWMIFVLVWVKKFSFIVCRCLKSFMWRLLVMLFLIVVVSYVCVMFSIVDSRKSFIMVVMSYLSSFRCGFLFVIGNSVLLKMCWMISGGMIVMVVLMMIRMFVKRIC